MLVISSQQFGLPALRSNKQREVSVYELIEKWRMFETRKPERQPQGFDDNVGVAGFSAISDILGLKLNCLSCVVTSVLDRAERKNCSLREDNAGYLCSKWLSLI